MPGNPADGDDGRLRGHIKPGVGEGLEVAFGIIRNAEF